jgi:RNA polymerase-binding transcription factor DksA
VAKSSKSTTPAKKPAGGSSAATKSKSASKPTAKSSEKKPAPAPAKSAKKPEPASSKSSVKTETKPSSAKGAAPAKAPSPAAKSPAAPAKAPAAPAKPPAAPAKAAPAPAAAMNASQAAAGKKIPPKGITIVQQKPMRKPKPKKLEMPASEPLLKPGGKWKPLIPSGPKAPPTGLVGHGTHAADATLLTKNRLTKKELDKYREILMRKRSELIGDIDNIENEALRQNSGSLSSLPQHMAEQGSDTFEQSISLDLAQVDRNLIREIDEALKRIELGTYGLCLRTGQRISAERLAEIPWAKYSIEAQRDLERNSYRTGE